MIDKSNNNNRHLIKIPTQHPKSLAAKKAEEDLGAKKAMGNRGAKKVVENQRVKGVMGVTAAEKDPRNPPKKRSLHQTRERKASS